MFLWYTGNSLMWLVLYEELYMFGFFRDRWWTPPALVMHRVMEVLCNETELCSLSLIQIKYLMQHGEYIADDAMVERTLYWLRRHDFVRRWKHTRTLTERAEETFALTEVSYQKYWWEARVPLQWFKIRFPLE